MDTPSYNMFLDVFPDWETAENTSVDLRNNAVTRANRHCICTTLALLILSAAIVGGGSFLAVTGGPSNHLLFFGGIVGGMTVVLPIAGMCVLYYLTYKRKVTAWNEYEERLAQLQSNDRIFEELENANTEQIEGAYKLLLDHEGIQIPDNVAADLLLRIKSDSSRCSELFVLAGDQLTVSHCARHPKYFARIVREKEQVLEAEEDQQFSAIYMAMDEDQSESFFDELLQNQEAQISDTLAAQLLLLIPPDINRCGELFERAGGQLTASHWARHPKYFASILSEKETPSREDARYFSQIYYLEMNADQRDELFAELSLLSAKTTLESYLQFSHDIDQSLLIRLISEVDLVAYAQRTVNIDTVPFDAMTSEQLVLFLQNTPYIEESVRCIIPHLNDRDSDNNALIAQLARYPNLIFQHDLGERMRLVAALVNKIDFASYATTIKSEQDFSIATLRILSPEQRYIFLNNVRPQLLGELDNLTLLSLLSTQDEEKIKNTLNALTEERRKSVFDFFQRTEYWGYEEIMKVFAENYSAFFPTLKMELVTSKFVRQFFGLLKGEKNKAYFFESISSEIGFPLFKQIKKDDRLAILGEFRNLEKQKLYLRLGKD